LPSPQQKIGYLALLGAICLFSTVEIASKIIGNHVNPVTLTFIRFFITGVILLLAALPAAKNKTCSRQDCFIFLLNGLIGITFALTLFHASILILAKAASAAVIFCINPIFVMILSHYINKEGWEKNKWLAALLGVAGVLLFSAESGIFSWKSIQGLTLMSCAAFLFALSVCISRQALLRHSPLLVMGMSSLWGSLFLLPAAIIMGDWRHILETPATGLSVLYITLCGTTLAYLLFYYGLQKTSAQAGGMVFFLKPVLAAFLACLILGEVINSWMIMGIVLVLAGLLLLSFPRR
jgi:drug/metabolite transporter (DMT)-like permease